MVHSLWCRRAQQKGMVIFMKNMDRKFKTWTSLLLVLILALSLTCGDWALAAEDDIEDTTAETTAVDVAENVEDTNDAENIMTLSDDENTTVYYSSSEGTSIFYNDGISLGTTTVDVEADVTVYYYFTPEVSGFYTFASEGPLVTTGRIRTIYEDGWGETTYNYSGDDANFSVNYYFSAGQQYALGAKLYDSNASGTITLTLTYNGDTTSGTCGDDLIWVLNSDGSLTISGTGLMADYSDGGSPWNDFNVEILTIVIEGGVTSIGNCAFYGCDSLTDVTIPDSVTSIGNEVFCYCQSLSSITIPNSVIYIGDEAFYYCTSLTNVTIPGSVTSISDYTFEWCTSLVGVTIENGVSDIGSGAFYGCYSLTDVTIPSSITSIGSQAFRRCTSLTDITSPDSVTEIGSSAFSGCTSLSSLTILGSNTTIGYNSFEGCGSLTSVTIADGVTGIESCGFYGCDGLADENGFVIINGVFCYYCGSATEITIPNDITAIGICAFEGCGDLTSVTIPDSVTDIEDKAFFGCTDLVAMSIGSNVTTIAYAAFSECTSLTNVSIPGSVTSIEESAFADCSSLTSVTISGSSVEIGITAFAVGFNPWVEERSGYLDSSLTQIVFEGSVASVGAYAFYGATATVYYPEDEENWTSDLMQDYGGTLTWESYIRYPYIINDLDIYSPIYTAMMGEDLTVRVNGSFSKFVEVRVDGITIAASDYDAYEGSTVVTLLSQYLDTLPRGQHSLTIVFSDGLAQSSFILTSRTISVLSGDGLTHVKNSGETIAIRFDANKTYVASVMVDGEAVSRSNYTVTTGSTIVTFSAAYLDTLSVGVHTVTANFGSYGTSSATMHIASATGSTGGTNINNDGGSTTSGGAATGDLAHPALWAFLLCISAAGIAGGILLNKKKQR